MPKMRIYCVRHGQTNYNLTSTLNSDPKVNVYLTDKGKQEGEELRNKLANKKIEIIFCSDMPRALETAKIINKSLKVPIKIDKRITEVNAGLEGQPYRLIAEYRKKAKDLWNAKLKGGESLKEEFQRVSSFFNDLRAKKYNIVLVVSHSDPLKLTNIYFKKYKTFEEQWHKPIRYTDILEFEI